MDRLHRYLRHLLRICDKLSPKALLYLQEDVLRRREMSSIGAAPSSSKLRQCDPCRRWVGAPFPPKRHLCGLQGTFQPYKRGSATRAGLNFDFRSDQAKLT
jgi:hypothetical protein